MPELIHLNSDRAGIKFSIENARQQPVDFFLSGQWLSADGEPVHCYHKQGLHHWLRFPDLADFRISADIKEISCFPLPDVQEVTIRHLLLDQVLPRCLAHLGNIMLHASAIQLKEGLILFLGDSGAGKSTLAGNFHQAGQPAVSDDCILIQKQRNTIKAIPTYRGLRLWNDSLGLLFPDEQEIASMTQYSAKSRVSFKGNDISFVTKGIPVLALFVLHPSDRNAQSEITLERLSNRESFIALIKQCFQLNIKDVGRIKHQMDKLGSFVPRLPTYRLSIPHDYDLLPFVRQKILDTVINPSE